jgi:oxaloacetate decarboxylase alpha subunit
MENQLREQGAADRLDEVLAEIPRVREDLGFIPLVTPTSQIVGTQAVINVLTGERYKSISKETAGVLKGEYGATAAPVNKELQAKVLDGTEPVTVRPADLIDDEMDKLTKEFDGLVSEHNLRVADAKVDDVLTYALFPQIGLKFLINRDNPDAFEPVPGEEPAPIPTTASPANVSGPASYVVNVDGQDYQVTVSEGGEVEQAVKTPSTTTPVFANSAVSLNSPLSGNIFKLLVKPGQQVAKDEVVMILEAMKMETEVRAIEAGTVTALAVKEGDSVAVGDVLMEIQH